MKNKYNKIWTPEDHKLLKKENSFQKETLYLEADAIVIGSGAGGAVAAAELSKNGYRIILIEEGPFAEADSFSPDEFQSLSRLYRDGAYISSEDFSIHILQGRCIGGSTTINWQTCIYPSRFTTDEWENQFGLKGYSREAMTPYIAEVEKRIGVQNIPENMINRNNDLLRKGARKMGISNSMNQNNNAGECIGLGRCGLGCPVNAKRSTLLTFIPDALKYGAKIFSCVRAEKIIDGSLKKVIARFSPDPGLTASDKLPADVIQHFEFTAKAVIVCAGAIETPSLLQRSELGNSMVGKRLKLHPVASLLSRFSKPVETFYGTPQTVVIDEYANFNQKGYGFIFEAAPYRPTITSLLVPFYGKPAFDAMKNYRYLQAGLVIVRDGSGGNVDASVEYSGSGRKVHFKLSKSDTSIMLNGIRNLALLMAAAGAKEIIFPFTRTSKPYAIKDGETFDWVLNEKADTGDILLGSAHPHGSVQASASPDDGALTPDFELYGHKNIFVMDGSWMPTAIGVNPQILIMSAAMKASRKVLL
ncbi:MAG: GMC family oxidoreductase N-terminal domain-containing protein [Spirochaetia bacterium]|nr:GMC family oxidoreductase N-terminal domain-containing protein [Spirochaetia bacterium]